MSKTWNSAPPLDACWNKARRAGRYVAAANAESRVARRVGYFAASLLSIRGLDAGHPVCRPFVSCRKFTGPSASRQPASHLPPRRLLRADSTRSCRTRGCAGKMHKHFSRIRRYAVHISAYVISACISAAARQLPQGRSSAAFFIINYQTGRCRMSVPDSTDPRATARHPLPQH